MTTSSKKTTTPGTEILGNAIAPVIMRIAVTRAAVASARAAPARGVAATADATSGMNWLSSSDFVGVGGRCSFSSLCF